MQTHHPKRSYDHPVRLAGYHSRNVVQASMTTMESETRIREAVRNTYATRSSKFTREAGGSCCSTETETTSEAEAFRAGCGHPVSSTTVKVGEVVLDLGSGAGAHLIQSSRNPRA